MKTKYKKDRDTEDINKTFFCSELIAAIYKKVGILDPNISSAYYWPGNFSTEKSLPLLKGAKLSHEMLIEFDLKLSIIMWVKLQIIKLHHFLLFISFMSFINELVDICWVEMCDFLYFISNSSCSLGVRETIDFFISLVILWVDRYSCLSSSFFC